MTAPAVVPVAAPITRSVTTVRPGPVVVIDGLLAPRYVQRLLDHWRGFPQFWLSSDGGTPTGPMRACNIAHRPEQAPVVAADPAMFHAVGRRMDATANFVRTGGRLDHAAEPAALSLARTNYFRATYISDVAIFSSVTLRLLHHPVLAAAARRIFDRPLVVPSQVYANVMLPGQELGLHTDVPEFRGADRRRYPLWLLVVMQHSGLFERWRVHLATAVLHLHADGHAHQAGGEFAYFAEGSSGTAQALPTRHNTALVLDTDRIFHGVDRVAGDDSVLHKFGPGLRLRYRDERWKLFDADSVLGSWESSELRYSISWKARCFADEVEQRVYVEHTDDLTNNQIMRMLTEPLDVAVEGLKPDELAMLLIDTYVRFPAS